MLPTPKDRPKLAAVLAQLAGAVEEMFLSGLTTVSESSKRVVQDAMEEAARFRLLRLSATLRAVTQQLGRFTTDSSRFSRELLVLMLRRAWILSRGLDHAIRTEDEKAYDRLSWTPTTQPLPKVEVVCIGVLKRVAAGAVSFEFRLRAVSDSPPLALGQRLLWSVVFPIKPDQDIPPEGFLHLPQKQKFTPYILLEHKRICIERANLAVDEQGTARLMLADDSTVVLGTSFDDWAPFHEWSAEAALARVRQQKPGPLDLDNELQEEIVLHDYRIGAAEEGDAPGRVVYPIAWNDLELRGTVSSEADGKALRKSLDEIKKLKRDLPKLFGLLHYERCRLVLQPLSLFRPEPDYITLSKEVVNKAMLLKALNFK
jgi:hypothetical protein